MRIYGDESRDTQRNGAKVKAFRHFPAALAACVVAAILSRGTPPVSTAIAQGQPQREPLDYFRDLMPVFIHNRCINCHGAVDPFTGLDHEGGLISPGESCTTAQCHNQADNSNPAADDDWKLAPAAVWFVKSSMTGRVEKDEKELCDQMADRVANFGAQDYMNHLQNDFLIDLGFQGRSGGANKDSPGPPPMPKRDFLVKAALWLDDGFGGCEREGTIIHTETITSQETTHNQGYELQVKQDGTREVTIQFANGHYSTKVQVNGSVTIIQTLQGDRNGVPCTTVITTITDYADVDDPGPSPNAGQAGTATVAVDLKATGEYTVTVRLPAEKHRQIERASLQDGCGSGMQPAPQNTLDQDWPGTRFAFRGRLPDPRDRTRLAGRELKRWFERGASPADDPWLPDHYAAMAQDGSIHPVDVKTSWNIRFRP